MADFDDLSLTPGPEPPFEPPARSSPPVSIIIVALAVLLLSAGALWYFVCRPKPPAPTAAPPAVAQTTVDLPRRAAEPGEAIDLPPLDQSDAVVRMLVGRLSSHPAVAAWL